MFGAQYGKSVISFISLVSEVCSREHWEFLIFSVKNVHRYIWYIWIEAIIISFYSAIGTHTPHQTGHFDWTIVENMLSQGDSYHHHHDPPTHLAEKPIPAPG